MALVHMAGAGPVLSMSSGFAAASPSTQSQLLPKSTHSYLGPFVLAHALDLLQEDSHTPPFGQFWSWAGKCRVSPYCSCSFFTLLGPGRMGVSQQDLKLMGLPWERRLGHISVHQLLPYPGSWFPDGLIPAFKINEGFSFCVSSGNVSFEHEKNTNMKVKLSSKINILKQQIKI